MKVALINGPAEGGSLFVREGRCTQKSSIWATQWPPITLAYLAAVAAARGHEARVFDCPARSMNAAALAQTLRDEGAELCAVAVSTPSFDEDARVIKILREALPGARMAVFGVHATARDREMIDSSLADFVIRNEPEETFGELLDCLRDGSDLAGVAGLTWRGPESATRNADRPFIADLDALPHPAWRLVDLDAYRLPFRRDRFLCLTPLRGCPYRCSFCTAGPYYGHRVRLRSVESVIGEIREDVERYGVRDFFVWAETFTIDRDFVLALCRAMRRETPGIRWTCNSRTDTADAEMLAEMRAAGCWMMSFGIESTSEEVLRKMDKRPRAADAAAPERLARRAGIRTLGHFILGMPGETRDSARRTIRDALRLDLDFVQFYTAAPFVGSRLYDQAKAEGYLLDGDESSISQTGASLRLPGLPPQEVNSLRRWATLRFYLRPRQIWRVLSMAGLGIVRQIIREAIRRARAG